MRMDFEFLQDILQEMDKLNIDLLLFGGFPFPAPPIKNPPRLLPAVPYNGIYNVLNFPAGSIPVCTFAKQ